MKIVTYGIGGYDPSQPNDNIVDETEVPDTGLGLSSLTAQDSARAVIEAVRDPKQADPSVADRLAALEALAVPPPEVA